MAAPKQSTGIMKQTRQKKVSLPQIKGPERRKSVAFTSRKKSVTSDTTYPSLPSIAKSGNDEESVDKTFKFVYSQAVERAFRRCFFSTDFGPISAKPTAPAIAVDKLEQIYDDWLSVKDLIAKKQEYIKKLQAEQEENPKKYGKYGRYNRYNSRNRTRLTSLTMESRRSSVDTRMTSRGESYTRLPSISSSHEPQTVATAVETPS